MRGPVSTFWIPYIHREPRAFEAPRSFQLEMVRGAKVHGHGIWSRNLHASRRYGVGHFGKALVYGLSCELRLGTYLVEQKSSRSYTQSS
jgi:hypothetical protein